MRRLLAATLAALTVGSASANLLVNGDFETPPNSSGPVAISNTNWTSTSSPCTIDYFTGPVFSGLQAIELNQGTCSAIGQTVNLTQGAGYQLSFAYVASEFLDFDVFFGGQNIFHVDAATLSPTPGQWLTATLSIISNAFVGTVEFRTSLPGATGTNFTGLAAIAPGNRPGLLLDAVNLTPNAIPEPASLAALGLGALVAGLARRRRH